MNGAVGVVTSGVRSGLRRLAREPLVPVLGALVAVLAVADPRPPAAYVGWLDLPSLAGLLALLTVAQGIRASGYVQAAARRILAHVGELRTLVLALVALAALLSMLVTNDVALFLVVPLTLALADMVELPRQRLVIFEALAVNAGSALSPVGNPQNLLLWGQSGRSMPGFAWALLPTVAVMLALLAVSVWWAFPRRLLRHVEVPARTSRDRHLGMAAAAALVGTLLLMQFDRPFLAASLVVTGMLLWRRRVLAGVDWVLLVTVALMLVGLGHLAAVPAVADWLGGFDWHRPLTVLAGGVALSQLISNVPATAALRHVVPDPLQLAIAVNIGGFGLVTGSLANLIALRLEGSRGIWWRFHLYSVPFLLVVAAVAAWRVA